MLEKESLLSIRHQRKRKLMRCGLPWMRYATSSWWRIGLRDAGGSPCAIAFEGLTKRYGGTVVLDGASADLEKGKIHGLIGRNGSGKTVLLKCLCGLTRFDEGCVKIRGRKELPFKRLPAGIGVIIEAPGFSPQYSGMRNLLHLAKLQNRAGKDEVRQAMAAVGLDPASRKHVGKYSLGMRQRLGIAQAFMEGQDILLLDEPMNGLDKEGLVDMRELFLRLKEQGRTIVLASHSSEDIGILCDTVHELEHGRMKRIR